MHRIRQAALAATKETPAVAGLMGCMQGLPSARKVPDTATHLSVQQVAGCLTHPTLPLSGRPLPPAASAALAPLRHTQPNHGILAVPCQTSAARPAANPASSQLYHALPQHALRDLPSTPSCTAALPTCMANSSSSTRAPTWSAVPKARISRTVSTRTPFSRITRRNSACACSMSVGGYGCVSVKVCPHVGGRK